MFLTPRSGSNKLLFDIKNGSSEQSVEAAQMPANQWVHVAVTLGGGTAKLYVNGQLKATKSGFTIKPSDFMPSTNYIGKSQFPDPLFNGMVDEFRLYNRVLSDAEIGAVLRPNRQLGMTTACSRSCWIKLQQQAMPVSIRLTACKLCIRLSLLRKLSSPMPTQARLKLTLQPTAYGWPMKVWSICRAFRRSLL